MDSERGRPTHVVARERIRQQLQTWRAEHRDWEVELQIPLDPNESDLGWYLMMTYHFDTDPIDESWYVPYLITSSLVAYLGMEHVLPETAFRVVNNILLDMQREIGVMHGGHVG